MFENVLVALDLSPAEQPILECLPALRDLGIKRLVLTHVIQVGYAQGAALARREDYVAWLEQCAQPLRAAGFVVDVDVRSGGVPGDEILNAANEIHADLIVIGSRGHNVISKLFLGSVARAVIHKTPVPLLLEWIEPTAQATRERCEAVCTDALRHVLFATDFSEHAAAAEKVLIAISARAAQVDCVHVATTEKEAAPTAHEQLATLVRRIEAHGGKATAALLHGKPAEEIARHAAIRDASLIVVGKHGQRWIASKLIGSTAAGLCEIAGRPVLMIP